MQTNKLSIAALIALCALAPFHTLRASELSIAELQALVSQKSYSEVLNRAGDVSPTKRDTVWRDTVLAAALAQGKTQSAQEFGNFDADLATRFPSVAELPAYRSYAQPRQIESAKQCMNESWGDVSYCIDSLKKALARDPSNQDFAYQAADAVASGSNASNAIFMLRNAISASNKKHCTGERTIQITMSALASPSDAGTKAAAEIAEFCFAQLQGPIGKAMAAESLGGYVLRNACPLMLKNNVLKGLAQQKCTATLKS